MKVSEMRNKSAQDLTNELVSLRKEQFALRLQRATGQAPKNIARLKTVQRELRGKTGSK
jgi:large subunit ribosomal protein L29